jgi:hypothetical protein
MEERGDKRVRIYKSDMGQIGSAFAMEHSHFFHMANEPEQRLINLPVGRQSDKQSAANLMAMELNNQIVFVNFFH